MAPCVGVLNEVATPACCTDGRDGLAARDSGYNERAHADGQFARCKQVIGDGLRFHSDEARATEVAIAAAVLNRMLDLGCPNSLRVA
jgi:hypothetical protein